MAQNPTEITLANLAGGALMECATLEFRKICANIQDPNTSAEAKRKLTIVVLIEPDAKRCSGRITYEVKSSIPGPDAGKTEAYIAFDPGSESYGLFEVERHPPLFKPEEPLPNVSELPAKRA
ncbi:hypothetical protein [Mesoterricola silvestris]|uniref:Uncharacterized protein n=1 Tax=Mesoterricola silvestris TaxID=2927979 RepID=A0AA48GW56_9BACT|nr:hypothetical protein [Mesoterricola silvestris]BDU72946.1 hypothetical protein METEAL_21200 [Mesoterricola silvestris]